MGSTICEEADIQDYGLQMDTHTQKDQSKLTYRHIDRTLKICINQSSIAKNLNAYNRSAKTIYSKNCRETLSN